MSATKFKAGDRVRVRKWEDMEREYGLFASGNINTPSFSFVKQMRQNCRATTSIKCVHGGGYTLFDMDGIFTDEMLEPITPAPMWYVGQEVWDDVLHPGETGRITHIESNGSIIVDFNNVPCCYAFDSIYFRFISAVPYTFSLPPQPEPIWIPEKWERVLVRHCDYDCWLPSIFFKYIPGPVGRYQTIHDGGNCYTLCIQFDPDKVGKV